MPGIDTTQALTPSPLLPRPQYSNLTDEQFKFAEQYVLNGGDAVAAYFHSHDNARLLEPAEIEQACTRLLTNTHLYYHIGHLQRQDNKRYDVDLEFLTRKLMKALSIAEVRNNPKGIQSAVMDIAKLHGFLVERTDNTHNHKFQTMKEITIDGTKITFDIGRAPSPSTPGNNPGITDVDVETTDTPPSVTDTPPSHPPDDYADDLL